MYGMKSSSQIYGSNSHTGSQPDLSKITDTSLTDSQITVRKRKQPDPDIEIKNSLKEFGQDLKVLMDICKSQKDDLTGLKLDVTDIKDQLANIRSTTENLVIEHNQFKTEMADFKVSLNFHSERQDTFCTRVDSIESKVNKMEVLEGDISGLKNAYHDLQTQHNLLQQRERLCNLEISGIPEHKSENLSALVLAIAEATGVQMSADPIKHVNRVQPRVVVPGKPKNIVVQFISTHFKDSILSGIRRKKGITTSDIGMPGESFKIYVNEHLIPYFKQLRKETKKAADAANYKYVWVRDGKIFTRKSDKSPVIYMKDMSDLDKIK